MDVLIIILFVAGYIAIMLEHSLRMNKAASALACGVGCWIVAFLQASDTTVVHEQLMHHFGSIASLMFFLLAAMTIVEVVDQHDGFDVISKAISARKLSSVLIIVSGISFFLSAVLDNLTTAIVMCTLVQKIIPEQRDRWWFASAIIISANAGGAWSPLGDVTTTMLWLGGQITTTTIIVHTLFPSLIVCTVSTLLIARRLRGRAFVSEQVPSPAASAEGRWILTSAMLLFVSVPFLSATTHLPPFMSMLMALGILWVGTTLLHRHKQPDEQRKYNVADALQRIDSSTILFFVGILLAVSALESIGVLNNIARTLHTIVGNHFVTAMLLGVFSAVIDNIPLIAAAQGMYPLTEIIMNDPFWSLLALTSGTGGSMIIIGSAAGVAVMGMENITVRWYFGNVMWIAALSFLAGCGTFFLLQMLM